MVTARGYTVQELLVCFVALILGQYLDALAGAVLTAPFSFPWDASFAEE